MREVGSFAENGDHLSDNVVEGQVRWPRMADDDALVALAAFGSVPVVREVGKRDATSLGDPIGFMVGTALLRAASSRSRRDR